MGVSPHRPDDARGRFRAWRGPAPIPPSLPKGRRRRQVAGGPFFSSEPGGDAITGSLRSNRTKVPYCCFAMEVPLLATMTLTSPVGGTAIAALAGCLLVYLAYKVLYRPDFGMPVRRRLLARGIRFRRDQFAIVPVWWSNLQIQRAISGHWKRSLRETVTRPGPPSPELTGRPSATGATAAWPAPATAWPDRTLGGRAAPGAGWRRP